MLQKIVFRPGINKEGTNYSNEGGWFSCDKIRFRSGFPEKLGGWVRATAGRFYRGVCRALINWVDLGNNNLIGIGTHLKYYINRSLYYDITPLAYTSSPALNNPFAVVDGVQIVTVTDGQYSPNIGDFVTYSGAVGFAGLSASDLNAEFQVTNVINSTTYQITLPAGTTPTSTTSGGGAAVVARYQISIGLPAYTIGNGFGAGVWNGVNVNTTFNTNLAYTSGPTPWVLLDALSTTINVVDTTDFPASGTLLIDGEVITYSGKTPTSFTGCVRGVNNMSSPGSTTLNGNLNATATTITVASTAGFPVPGLRSTGILRVNNEIITYTGVTPTSFTGCLRGTNGTTAATHSTGATVAQYAGEEHGLRPTADTPDPVIVYSVLGPIGTTGWGNATTGAGVGVAQQLRLWTHDNFGQDLVFAVRGGPIYYWANNTSTFPRGVELTTDVPIVGTNQVVVSDVSRFVIAMGCNSFGSTTFDPMVVRWSDQENPNVWTPLATNQSGEQRLSNGSYIVQARKTRQEIVIWTDAAVYSMQYLGPPYVWGFQLLMDNISIISPNSAITVNNVSYWMGVDKFYMYSGRVETLPCALRQYVFEDINFDQRFQVVAGTNEGYNEVWWFYVSNDEVAAATSAGRPPSVDKYVIYNYLERIWYYGTLSRTFWLDSPLQTNPMAVFGDQNTGTILFHESGVDDNSTATTQPISAFVQSSDFDIGDGHNFGFVWRMLPDVNFNGSNVPNPKVTLTLLPRQNSGTNYGAADTPLVTSANNYAIARQYEVQQFTGQVYTRLRGRQMSFKIDSQDLGVTWQLGSPRLDIRNDGRR